MQDDVAAADVSEADIIAIIAGACPQLVAPDTGVGDDAAVVHMSGSAVALSMDLAVEQHDWRDEWSRGADVGWKVCVQNVADVWAMGVRPESLLVGLALRPDTPVAWVQDFAVGLGQAMRAYGVTLAGGDVSAAEHKHVAVTAFGGSCERIVPRGGAKPGQRLYVTGPVGDSAAGFEILRGLGESAEPEYDEMCAAVAVHRRPQPALGSDGPAAAACASAMIDISDGLVKDVRRVAAASNVGVVLRPETIEQLMQRLQRTAPGLDPAHHRACVLGSGEEHVLALTVPQPQGVPDHWMYVGDTVASHPGDVSLGGELIDGSSGFEHFA